MNDRERILRDELERIAADAQLRPGMFETTLRRAQRRRSIAVTVAAAALIAIATLAAVVIPDRRGEQENPASPDIDAGVVRLLTERKGLLELEASKGQLCYRFEMRGVTSTQVIDRQSGEVAFDVGATDHHPLGLVGCQRDVDPHSLNAVARDPDRYVLRFANSASGRTEDADMQPDQGEPTCYQTRLTSQEYSLHLSDIEGTSGDLIHVWAPTSRDEAGRYARSGGFEMWWNSRTPDGLQPITDGPAVRLFSIDTNDRCYFQATFEVPNVPAGTYRITGFMFDDPRSDGYGIWPGPRFRVISDEHRQEASGIQVETETIDIKDQPMALATGEGSVWATTGMRRELLEMRDGDIINRYDGGGVGLAIRDGIVWQTRGGDGAEPDGEVIATDASSGEIVSRWTFARESPYGVAPTADGAFVALTGGHLVRVVLGESEYTPIALATGIRDVLVAHGAIWASQPGGQNPRVWRVTVDGARPNAEPFLLTPQGKGTCPGNLAATPDAVWVADPCAAAVWKLDPSGNVVDRIKNVGKKPVDIAVGPRFLFVSSFRGDETVTLVDRRTEKPVAQVAVGEGPLAIVAEGQGAWVANSEGTTLTHILPHTRAR